MKFNYGAAGWMVVAGLVSVFAPAIGRAAEKDDELILEVLALSLYAPSDSVDAVSDDGWLEGISLGLGYDLTNYVAPGLRGYVLFDAIGESKERFDGGVNLDWSRQVVMLAGDYGPDLWGMFRPSVRLGLGYATQGLQVQSGGASGAKYHDRTHDLAALGAVGFELYIPYSTQEVGGSIFKRFTVGLSGHVGYMLQTTAEFDELEAADDAWQHAPLNVGGLDMDGVYWNLGLAVRVKI